MLRVHPKVKVVMAIASPAVPGAAEAVKQAAVADLLLLTKTDLADTVRVAALKARLAAIRTQLGQ